MAQILSPDMPHRLACSVNVSIPHQTRTAVTHSSHPGRPGHHLDAAQGLRSSPPLYTPLLPPEGTPFSGPANDFFVKSHWGRREGGRAGGRARPEPRTCFKLQDLGDGPGQCPTVTPGPSLASTSRCFLQWKVAGQGSQWRKRRGGAQGIRALGTSEI